MTDTPKPKRKQGAGAIEKRKEKRNIKFEAERQQKAQKKAAKAAITPAAPPAAVAAKREHPESKNDDANPSAKKQKVEPAATVANMGIANEAASASKSAAPKIPANDNSGVVMKAVKLTDDKKAKLLQALSRSKSNNTKPTNSKSESSSKSGEATPKQPTAKPPQQPKKTATPTATNQLTELQAKMKKTLSGGRFRMINEQLYTTTSDIAVNLFLKEPETFDIYHEGFRAQVESWPSNPVDHYIKTLSALTPSKSAKSGQQKPIVIVDMGCGEAALAKSIMALNTTESKRFMVHSFDLASPNEYVVACDIRNVPLKDEEADVVVFSLSLMGTNFLDFIKEAWRILKTGGNLKIAEVVSRFPSVNKFIEALVALGFKLTSKNTSNKMFVFFEFVKLAKAPEAKRKEAKDDDEKPLLTPCLYRKR
ncbi:25S rRNA (adenine645-N1)-methyltransferase [Chytriomyces hyalinus]|nr:25S rRNA (adenine645-N1)-methyltransferase [Chytriomyces hyalinus]